MRIKKGSIILIAIFMLFGCTKVNTDLPGDKTPEEVKEDTLISFYGIGDVIVYGGMCNYFKASEEYPNHDFSSFFTSLKDDIQNADIAFVNQETILAAPTIPCSGYPTFSTPNDMGKLLVNMGADFVNQATNHTLDYSTKGVELTLDFWKQYPQVKVVGIAGSQEERDTIDIIEKEGIKVAMLSYTYGTNGIPIPAGKEYLVNMYRNSYVDSASFQNFKQQQVKEDVLKAQQQADVVLVSMHWGDEYQTTPNDEQKQIAQFLADLGVHVIIGTHPHIIQPIEWVEGENGNKTLVAYSLGNSVSSQNRSRSMLGGGLGFNIRKDGESGIIHIEDAYFEPIVTHQYYYLRGVQVYKLKDYTQELASQHTLAKKNADPYNDNKEPNYPFTRQMLVDLVNQVIGDTVTIKW